MAKKTRVVITGVGPVTSIGIGRQALWENLLARKTNVALAEFSVGGELWDKYYVHKVEGFDINRFGLDPARLDWIKDWKEGEENRDLQYLLAAVALALEDSGLAAAGEEASEIGFVLSHENLGLTPFLLKVSERAYSLLAGNKRPPSRREFYAALYKDCVKSGYDVQPFMTLFHLAKAFNAHQYSLFVCNACASGLYAIEAASQMIKNNQNSVVAVAASDHPDIYKYLWFRDLGIYAKDGLIRPFAKDSSGLVFGDGGAALIMEELGHARKRGAPIYAEYLGGGFSSEGWQVTTPQIGSGSYPAAMRTALEQGGVAAKDIDLLCPHGVGSRVIDYYEAKAVTDVFGRNPRRPRITAFKPYVGHNLGGSALLETAMLLLSLKHGTLLPTLNGDNVDPAYGIGLVEEMREEEIDIAMKTCCAFAGFNAACVFRKAGD